MTEIKSALPKSFDDALRQGVARAHKTLKNVQSAWIQNPEMMLNDKGEIDEYRVHLKVTLSSRTGATELTCDQMLAYGSAD